LKILLTNDDGINSPELWELAGELKNIAGVVVAAPDREQSAIGTAITLRQPLRVQKVKPHVPGVEAYAIEGTGGDAVIMALGKLIPGGTDLAVSGVNQGLNLGDDILISGTVGAALQAYLRGIPAIAVSVAGKNNPGLPSAARLTRLLAQKISDKLFPEDIFLNVNVPDIPAEDIRGIRLTGRAHRTHTDTVEEGTDGRREYYWLMRHRLETEVSPDSDVAALEQGYISITPLHTILFNKPALEPSNGFFSGLFEELKKV
jgi:5'-nucleotidase